MINWGEKISSQFSHSGGLTLVSINFKVLMFTYKAPVVPKLFNPADRLGKAGHPLCSCACVGVKEQEGTYVGGRALMRMHKGWQGAYVGGHVLVRMHKVWHGAHGALVCMHEGVGEALT